MVTNLTNMINKRLVVLTFFLIVGLLAAFIFLAYSAFRSELPRRSEDEIAEQWEDYIVSEEGEHPLGYETSLLVEMGSYKGRYFTYAYDNKEGIFYFYTDPANKEEGNKEFDQFLKDNGIPKRRYIESLKESTIPLPTPVSE